MISMTLIEKRTLTPNIIELVLQAPQDFQFTAGQYILLGMTADEMKPFSIANAPREEATLTLQIKDTDQSVWMQSLFGLAIGSELLVEGPKDQYPPAETQGNLFFIAGGTGYSPMCSLLEDLIAKPNQTEIKFYWGTKTFAELYHHEHISALSDTLTNVKYIPVLSEPTHDWPGETGWVHLKALADFNQLTPAEKAQTHVYLCGPWDMRQQAEADFLAAGLEKTHFH